MTPRIVFVVMSAVAPAAMVDQLARSLSPHRVLVHHDFSQTPEFAPSAPNVAFVPNPVRTGWANFGFTEGIFHAMRHALRELDFDYLQLLSPSCLPIKSMASFERHVAGAADAHFDHLPILEDRDALMCVGYRAFTPQGTLRHRVARRLSRIYYGDSTGRRDEAGIWLRAGFAAGADGAPTAGARLGLAAIRALSDPRIGRHPFDASLPPYTGSTWFGARRAVVAGLVEDFGDAPLRAWFSRLRHADEILLATLLKRRARHPAPGNHYVHTFVESRAGTVDDGCFELLAGHPAHFARKFPDDLGSTIRRRVLAELVGGVTLDATAPAR